MSKIIDFADGFTSATAPNISGDSPEVYSLLNNRSTFTPVSGLIFNSANETSVFMLAEIERKDNTPLVYRQSISLIAAFNGSIWTLEPGSYIGTSIVADSLANSYNMQLQMNGGQVEYKTGNMTGGGATTKLKLSVTRISA